MIGAVFVHSNRNYTLIVWINSTQILITSVIIDRPKTGLFCILFVFWVKIIYVKCAFVLKLTCDVKVGVYVLCFAIIDEHSAPQNFDCLCASASDIINIVAKLKKQNRKKCS